MNKNELVVVVNLWGLGDLFPSFYFIKKNSSIKYYLVTTQKKEIVEKLIDSINLNADISVRSCEKKISILLEILKNILKNNLIIFTAPLSGKSRKFAILLSFFFKNIILADEKGNMYDLNEKIKLQ
jgi:hypothetical protein